MPTKPSFGTPLNSNPLNADVIEAWLIAEGSGSSIVDSQTAGTATLNTSGVEWDTDGPFGTAPILKLNAGYANGDTVPDYIEASFPPYDSLVEGPATALRPKEFSATIWLRTDHPNLTQFFLYKNDGRTDYTQGFYLIYIAPPFDSLDPPFWAIQFQGLSSATDLGSAWKIPGGLDGNWHQFAVTTDGTLDSDGLKLYMDGVLLEKYSPPSNYTATDPAPDTDTPLFIGSGPQHYVDGSSRDYYHLRGEIDTVVLFNRELTDVEVASLYDDPYQLWGSGGGGGGSPQTVFPASIASSAAFGAPSLVFEQIISPDSITSAEAWGNPKLGGFQPGVAF